jgi:hypothetical protein
MDLLINYGTNASSGGQPVIAEIELITTTTTTPTGPTTPYNLTFISGSFWETNNNLVSNSTFYRTDKVNVVGGSQMALNNPQLASYSLQFWNSSNQVVAIYAPWYDGSNTQAGGLAIDLVPNQLTVPSNATQFAVSSTSNSYGGNPGNTFAQFQQLVVSQVNTVTTTTTTATTTFYDSYPGGNVVGTTAGTDQGTYLQIDPPTGKRIKQIALKGL